MAKFKPIQNRVVVKPIEKEENKTAGGIFLPDSAEKEKPQMGKVIAIGTGEDVKKDIKLDDQVLFGKYSGTEVKLDDEKYLVLNLEDILAVVE
ncbi:MAG: co-chaperone GroES [Candidatus Cloacimonadota bacterium]|nr:MAG: co-chaperone GroES [Candidatus Cloacimonadota bacterium]PIE80613.1 MAG: co-chaperone GroES [Candidatus Delongbacteria bacterium]